MPKRIIWDLRAQLQTPSRVPATQSCTGQACTSTGAAGSYCRKQLLPSLLLLPCSAGHGCGEGDGVPGKHRCRCPAQSLRPPGHDGWRPHPAPRSPPSSHAYTRVNQGHDPREAEGAVPAGAWRGRRVRGAGPRPPRQPPAPAAAPPAR